MLRALQMIGAEVTVYPPLRDQKPSFRKSAPIKTSSAFPEWVRRPLRNMRRQWSAIQSKLNQPREFARSVASLKEALTASDADVVLARLEIPTLRFLTEIREWNRPLLMLVDAALFHEVEKVRNDSISQKEKELERILWEKADALIVLSAGLASMIEAQGIDRSKMHINPLGVDPVRFHPGVDGGWVCEKYALHGKKVVGYVGKLSKIHDLDTLIHAYAIVRNQQQGETKLLIVGDGPEKSHLELLVTQLGLDGTVIFTGYVSYEEIPAHIAAMDVVTTPLHKENITYSSPLKMFEYMAMAKPIVMPRGGQVSEVLDGQEMALLVEPESAQEMADAIIKLLTNPQECAAMGQRAREFVSQNYTWEMNAYRIIEVSRKLLNGLESR
jgi:glycosyltransferase involved in cell wall biosynthesis